MASPKKTKSEPKVQRGSHLKTRDEETLNKMAQELDKWSLVEENIWLNDFFLDQGIITRQWHPWRERNKAFDEACIRAMQRQESKLLKGGLKSKYNASITKSALSCVHGWEADQETLTKACLKGMMELMNQAKPKGSLIEDS